MNGPRGNWRTGSPLFFIVVPEKDHQTIVGFFTLSSQQNTCDILPEEFSQEDQRLQSRGRHVARQNGRMAVAQKFQNQKLGRFVLFAALYEALRSKKHVSSFAVVVDAKTEKVVPFYEKYGFRRLEGNRLIVPMKTIEELVGGAAAAQTATAAARPSTSS